MAILKIHCVIKFGRRKWNFGEGSMYQTGMVLKQYYDQAMRTPKAHSKFKETAFSWGSNRAGVTDDDLVCYVLDDANESIVARHTSDPLGSGGSTYYVRGKGVISEVYMSQVDGDPNRSRLLANIIFHELIHNKIDAAYPTKKVSYKGRIVSDVHSIPGVLLGKGGDPKKGVTSSMRPSKTDLELARLGLDHPIRQFNRQMPREELVSSHRAILHNVE